MTSRSPFWTVVRQSIGFLILLAILVGLLEQLSLSETVVFWGWKAVMISIVLKVGHELNRFFQLWIPRFLGRDRSWVDAFLPTILRTVSVSIWAVALIFILDQLGFNVGALLAGLGIGGAVLALAAQETLSNVVASFWLLAEQPFKMGDTIQVGDMSGKVVAMGLRCTTLSHGLEFIKIPNKIIISNSVIIQKS